MGQVPRSAAWLEDQFNIQNERSQTMKRNIAFLNRAQHWFGRGYMINPKNLFRRLAGSLPGVMVWLAVVPLAALGQANYATPYTFITIAGAAGAAGSADGTNRAARFDYPTGVALDSAGNLYVADEYTIRKVTPAGPYWVVTTLAGKAGSPGSADGTNSAARFNQPSFLGMDSAGDLYVSDWGNDTIRKVTPVGTNWVVTTVAGLAGSPGSADGTNRAARFNWPIYVAVDSAGDLYVSDSNNCTIRKMTPFGTNWVVTTLAGLGGVDSSDNPLYSGSADGTGSAARFNEQVGVAVDSAGNLYVADWLNYTIRKGFPASSVLPPILQPPSLNAGLFGFGITGLPGLSVNIESSTNLSSWQLITTFVLVGGTNYYSASPNPAQGAQFYRAHVR